MKKLIVKAKLENVENVITFIKNTLTEFKLNSKDTNKALLLSEESFVTLVKSSLECNDIIITISKSILNTRIKLKCKGNEIKTPISNVINNENLYDEIDDSTEDIIRNLIIKNNEDNITASRKNNYNVITITATESNQKALLTSIFSIIFAIVFGIVIKLLCPEEITTIIHTNILEPVKTIFLRALKLMVAPLIFFSISSSVASFTDLKELGKIGFKTIKYYLFTSIIAITIALTVFKVFDFGTFNEFSYLSSGVVTESESEISLLDTIINIVPTDIVSPILNMDFLQIIFLAVIIGAAASMLGASSEKVSAFLNNCNTLFIKTMSIIIKGLPLLIISSISDLIIMANINETKSIFTLLLFIIISEFIMLVAYLILVLIGTGRNPIKFLKKAFPAYLNAFSISSSNASMPFTMNICDKNLKISPKIYTFSIPLGATINMDGIAMAITLTLLYFAKTFGIVLTFTDIIKLIVSVLVISVGAPGVPGTCIVCLSMLFNMFGIPQEALTLFVGISALFDPFDTATNVMGDVVGTYVTACRNNLILEDEENNDNNKNKINNVI